MLDRFTKRILVQPAVAIAVAVVLAGITTELWFVHPITTLSASLRSQLVLTGVLMIGFYLSKHYPVHIRFTQKLELGSIALYLLAVVLPPVPAVLAVVLSTLAAEFSVKQVRGLYWSDIVTQTSRLGVATVLASLVAHAGNLGETASVAPVLQIALAIGTAVTLLVVETLTVPLLVAPITGERPTQIVWETTQGMGLAEMGQYVLGIMGALLSQIDPFAVLLLCLPVGMIYKVSKRTKEMHESTRILLENLADQVDSRDPFTHEHSKRVTEWTRKLLREMNIVGPEAQLIVTAARVHDIGKIRVPDSVLHKHERLTDEEWAIMEQHPADGAEMIKSYPAFARGAAIVRGHHERFDGKGYPDRLAGTHIPFGARLMAVVDSFDAMVSDRPYRKGMSWERAAGILASGAGSQWDPEIVASFLQVIAPQLEAAHLQEAVNAGQAANLLTV